MDNRIEETKRKIFAAENKKNPKLTFDSFNRQVILNGLASKLKEHGIDPTRAGDPQFVELYLALRSTKGASTLSKKPMSAPKKNGNRRTLRKKSKGRTRLLRYHPKKRNIPEKYILLRRCFSDGVHKMDRKRREMWCLDNETCWTYIKDCIDIFGLRKAFGMKPWQPANGSTITEHDRRVRLCNKYCAPLEEVLKFIAELELKRKGNNGTQK